MITANITVKITLTVIDEDIVHDDNLITILIYQTVAHVAIDQQHPFTNLNANTVIYYYYNHYIIANVNLVHTTLNFYNIFLATKPMEANNIHDNSAAKDEQTTYKVQEVIQDHTLVDQNILIIFVNYITLHQ